MDRDVERDTRPAPLEGPNEGPIGREIREQPSFEAARPGREHELTRVRGVYVSLCLAEAETLWDLGRFRTVAVADLQAFRYGGDARLLQQDLRALETQGLVKRRSVWNGPGSRALPVVVLTKTGKEALATHELATTSEASRAPQALYSGFVKPNEVRHDAAIYRMFQAEKRRLESTGARVRRVVLDYELKARVYAPLARSRSLPKADFARLQAEVARANGLKVIGGRIPLPDLRIEYEQADGQLASVDLELATGHYHAGAMATKALAGFRFYAADGSAARLTRVLEERDLTVAILSL